MKIEFRNEPLTELKCAVLVAFGFEGNPASSGTVERLPSGTRAVLDELQTSGELTGKSYECTLIHHPAGIAAQKLLVVGGGKKENFDDIRLRRLSGTAVRYLRARSVHEMVWLLGRREAKAAGIQSVVEGAIVADYDAEDG